MGAFQRLPEAQEELIMYRRILVAADPDGLAINAAPAPAVAALADSEQAQVLIVVVHRESERADRRRAGEATVNRLFDELKARRLDVHIARRERPEGRVAEVIATEARAFHADLIVMGSHHHGHLVGLFTGSVGHALAALVRTPILVVSDGEARGDAAFQRILVAVDGGAPSYQAVVATAAIAGRDAEVTVLYVDRPVRGLNAYSPYVDQEPAAREAEGTLREASKLLRAASVQASARRAYAISGIGAAIAREADDLDVDLIVLGSRRPGNVDALLLGSVAHEVVARTYRPVLLAAAAGATQLWVDEPGVEVWRAR